MFRSILVATDGSDHARKAIDLASDVARQYGASLVLLHVLQRRGMPDELRHLAEIEHLADDAGGGARPAERPTELPETLADGEESTALRRAYEALGKRILGAAEREARAKGVEQVRGVLETGDPVARILECAEREGVDLIVLGSRGLGELKGLLMGSVSHKVNQLARCTCVTVK